LLSVNFNQDASCFVAGTETGFIVWSTDPLQERFRRDFNGKGIGLVQPLFNTNILALVGGGKNPKFPKNVVSIWDDKRAERIAEIVFRHEVKSVRLRRDYIITVTESAIYIHDFKKLQLNYQFDTGDTGVCAINHSENLIFAFPSKAEVGVITVKDGNKEVFHIKAQDHKITQICMNHTGTRIASCSENGTTISVFNTATKELIKKFQRGQTYATITSLAFNRDGTMLCCASNSQTVHIYLIEAENPQNAVSRVSSFLWGSSVAFEKSTWQFQIPDIQSICAFSEGEKPKSESDPKKYSIIALGASGIYYKYSFSLDKKPECTQEKREYYYRSAV